MSKIGKPEVNLELGPGFFRISTDNVVYNITVTGGQDFGKMPDPGQIALAGPWPLPSLAAPKGEPFELGRESACDMPGDDYYKKVSSDIFNDIGKLAKSLSSTMGEIPLEDRRLKRVELDEAGEKIEDAKNQLHDIVSMTERATMEIMDQVEKVQGQTDGVKELLQSLKNHSAFQSCALPADDPEGPSAAELLNNLQEKLGLAGELAAGMQHGGESPAVEDTDADDSPAAFAPEMVIRSRYLFSIDTVLQTMYELCTNETVKSHITGARQRAEEIFDRDAFLEAMGEKVQALAPDSDNFFTVPLSDVLSALFAACSDPKIQNLLKKMDINQAEIFLDQSLPLEVPAREDIEELILPHAGEEPQASPSSPAGGSAPADPEIARLKEMLSDSLALAGELGHALTRAPAQPPGMSLMSMEDQNEIFARIESAFQIASSITDDISRITEALSFQDLSGQQILKIIKLLTDFQVQLLAIVVSFGSQLKNKEQNAAITAEESKRIAQEDVDKYLKSMTTEEVGGEGSLDQAAVNDLLQNLGF